MGELVMLRQRLEKVVGILRADERLVVKRWFIEKPVSDEAIEQARSNGVSISDDVRALYKAFNGVHIRWTCSLEAHPEIPKFDETDRKVSGLIRFLGFDSLLSRPVSYIRFHKKWFDDEEVEDLALYRPMVGSHGGFSMGFMLDDGRLNGELYTIMAEDAEGFSGPISMTLSQYLMKASESFGIAHPRDIAMEVEDRRAAHYAAALFSGSNSDPS